MAAGLPIALTIDDAPSIGAALPVVFEAARIDSTREALQRAGIERCVAFVIGQHARGHEARLVRWLEAGYELGNHSDDHRHASLSDRAAFAASLERCDALLGSIGAFDAGRPRYFRFPYGDRGRSPQARGELLQLCRDRGYAIADISISFHDDCYEAPLASALNAAPRRVRAIEQRYLANVDAGVARARRAVGGRFASEHVHVAGCHFGLVTQRTLGELLARLSPRVQWVGLERAVDGDRYTRFLSDPATNGILAEDVRGDRLRRRVLRRLARLARQTGLFEQRALGPRWPHLAP